MSGVRQDAAAVIPTAGLHTTPAIHQLRGLYASSQAAGEQNSGKFEGSEYCGGKVSKDRKSVIRQANIEIPWAARQNSLPGERPEKLSFRI